MSIPQKEFLKIFYPSPRFNKIKKFLKIVFRTYDFGGTEKTSDRLFAQCQRAERSFGVEVLRIQLNGLPSKRKNTKTTFPFKTKGETGKGISKYF